MDHYQYDPESKNDNINNSNNNNNFNGINLERKDRVATASLICGILAIPGTFTVWLGVIFSIAAIALAIISRLNKGKFEGRAVAGITLGIVFAIISFMLFSVVLKMLNNPDTMNSILKYMESIQNQ